MTPGRHGGAQACRVLRTHQVGATDTASPVRAATDRERGAATVLLLAVVVVALVLATGAVALARAAHARGTAQAAADLAAIAAAEAAQRPVGGDPCGVAVEVATANGATTATCTLEPGGFVSVTTSVVVVPLAGWRTTATAGSRAGPVM
jgi:secretion/DNA translocation related TadE-like protein